MYAAGHRPSGGEDGSEDFSEVPMEAENVYIYFLKNVITTDGEAFFKNV